MTLTFQTGTYKIKSRFDRDFERASVELLTVPSKVEGTIDNSRIAGFTLLELLVVVFIISLSLAVITPSLWKSEKSALKTEARHISSTMRYIYDETIGKKRPYVLGFNIDERSWGFESDNETRNFKIKRDIEIRDVFIPSHGEISTGEVFIVFGPTGPEEPLILHLMKGQSEYTIIFNHLSGRTKIFEGYIL